MDTKLILVAEDDPVLKNLLGHTFAGKYQTLYARDGAEALALFEKYKPALLMLDLLMPGVDGFAVLEKIRGRQDEFKSVPIIIVSNLGAEKDKQRARELGATDYLVKAENSIDEIVARIAKALGE
ncbi:MAG TPA: response regulator [Candidatus Paceibacterota bacterium]|nr:response regulator [Candidatus Paceibacterota bacterium]